MHLCMYVFFGLLPLHKKPAGFHLGGSILVASSDAINFLAAPPIDTIVRKGDDSTNTSKWGQNFNTSCSFLHQTNAMNQAEATAKLF